MSSRIEDVISEIEEYIDSCKPSAFSSTKIVVNRDEIDSLLEELRSKTPDEIKRYQKIINNKEAILADAQTKADAIIAQAQIQTNELVSEHQIMQQAYAQANEVVNVATKNAQEMLDKATEDANSIRTGAIEYTDDLLSRVQSIVENTLRDASQYHTALTEAVRTSDEQFSSSMNGYLDLIQQNREELRPVPVQTPHIEKSAKSESRPSADSKLAATADLEASAEEDASIEVPDELFS